MLRKLRKWKHRYRCYKISKILKECGTEFEIGDTATFVGAHNIKIGCNFSGGQFLKLQTWEYYNGIKVSDSPMLEIGDNVSIMDNGHISCMKKVTIGNGCLFGDNVFITDNFHGGQQKEELLMPPLERNLVCKGKINIGKNVWLGRNVCVMPGVTIGEGSIVGANAVVTKDIPEYSVAVGVPARVVKNCKINFNE